MPALVMWGPIFQENWAINPLWFSAPEQWLKISWPVTSEGDTGEGLLPSSFPPAKMPCSRWDLLEKSSTYSEKQWKEASGNHHGRRVEEGNYRQTAAQTRNQHRQAGLQGRAGRHSHPSPEQGCLSLWQWFPQQSPAWSLVFLCFLQLPTANVNTRLLQGRETAESRPWGWLYFISLLCHFQHAALWH